MLLRSGLSGNRGWAHLDERNTTWEIPVSLETPLAKSSRVWGVTVRSAFMHSSPKKAGQASEIPGLQNLGYWI